MFVKNNPDRKNIYIISVVANVVTRDNAYLLQSYFVYFLKSQRPMLDILQGVSSRGVQFTSKILA